VKYADLDAARRRLLTFHARSAAVLRLGDAKIQELENLKLAALDGKDEEEAGRLAARLVFLENLWLVRRMANRQPIYEIVDGLHCIMYAPDELTDRRIFAIQQLARKLKISEADLDAETDRALTLEEADRERSDKLVSEFMAKLPKTPTRWIPPPSGDRRSWRRVVNYDDTRLRELEEVMPASRRIEMEMEERLRLDAQLLGDLGDHLQRDASIDGPGPPSREDTPARRASLLVAACEIASKYDNERRAALKRKSSILLKEFPRGAGDGPKYSARSNDLEAELLQPLQENLARFRGLVIRLAVRVAAVDAWPVGVTKFERALALGRTLVVEDADLATARASLGFARLETKHGEPER
jgi:hypothetical protein